MRREIELQEITYQPLSSTENHDSPTVSNSSPSPLLFAPDPAHKVRDIFFDLMSFVNAFAGLNFLYVSFAFSMSGIYRGTIFLFLIIFASQYCSICLVQVRKEMNIRPEVTVTYGDVARFAAGPKAELVLNLTLILAHFGYCTGYLIFLAQTLHDVLDSEKKAWMFVFFPLPFLIVLSLVYRVKSLGPFVTVSNFAFLIGLVSVIAYILVHFQWQPSNPSVLKLPLFFGQMTAALEGAGLVIPIETSMNYPKYFKAVIRTALLIMGTILISIGVLGFATFGDKVESIILLNMQNSPLVVPIKLLLCVGILLTYPLQLTPVIHAVDAWVLAQHHHDKKSSIKKQLPNLRLQEFEMEEPHRDNSNHNGNDSSATSAPSYYSNSLSSSASSKASSKSNPESTTPAPSTFTSSSTAASSSSHKSTNTAASSLNTHSELLQDPFFVKDTRIALGRVLIVLLTACVAMLAGAHFGIFQSLVGALAAAPISYTIPAYLHYCVFKSEMNYWQKTRHMCLMAFGILGAIAGTTAAIYEISLLHSEGLR